MGNMYQNNKSNLWLRTICVTVVLLGMLFFTHNQFSSATAPTNITITFSTTDSSPLDVGNTLSFTLVVTTSETVNGDATLDYTIGTAGKTATLSGVDGTGDAAGTITYTGSYLIADGDNGMVGFTKVNFATSVEAAMDYTTSTTVMVDTRLNSINVDTIEDITDVTSLKVEISSSSPDTTVTKGETVNVDVNVVNSAQGVAVVTPDAVAGDTTAHTLQYDIGGSGTSTDLPLLQGANNTHFTGMLAVGDMTTEGAFTFDSVKLSLQNGDGDATAAEVKTYTTTTTVMVALTDGMYTLDPPNAITDVTSLKVEISASGDDTTVTEGEIVTVDVNVGNAPEGVAVVADDAHTLQYKIGASGETTDLALLQGENDTHFTGTLTVAAGTTEGAFTFESVKLSLQNGNGDAATAVEKTYTTEMTSAVVVTLIDAGLTLDPPNAVTDVTVEANATTAEGGDKVTFTAWVTNSTEGLVQSVTVNYKIDTDTDVTGTVNLTNQGLNGTSTTVNLWSDTLTLADNVTAGNLTIVSIVVIAKNADGSLSASQTITAADAKATNVVKIEVPAAVDNTTSSAATSASDTSSSESASDSPVSIFAVFILIASVSMAVGVYTLRRRQ